MPRPPASKAAKKGGSDGFIPLEAGNQATTSGRGSKAAAEPSAAGQESRVVYIGHLPHGFYERELLGFFTQFGKLTRVRLSRNKKTTKAKGYAFLEFQYPEVAKIAAAAMDGYFLMKQKIRCHVMRSEDVHPMLFKGANTKFKNIPWRKIERQRHDKERTPEEHARRVARLLKRDKLRQAKIQAAGIEFEYEGLQAAMPTKSKKITFE